MQIEILTTPSTTKILTIHDVLIEDDAFEYSPFYDGWIEVFVTKEREDANRDTI